MRALGRTSLIVTSMALFGLIAPPQSWGDTTPFPDMSRYTPANVADYQIDASTPGIHATQVVFLTPDGIRCSFSPTTAGCTGNAFPSVPPVTNGVNNIGTDRGIYQTSDGFGYPSNIKTLPPFHTLTVNGVTCGVDDARTTACKDSQGRGFVLSPNGSGWLPHV